MAARTAILQALRHGLIVSCQADPADPLGDPAILAALAASAERGGAVAIRARGVEAIRTVTAAVRVPIVGLTKDHHPGSPVYITPTREAVVACIATGAPIVALDATARHRPDGVPLAEIVRFVRATSDVLLMADIATLAEGEAAAALGFDLIATTLSGYTTEDPPSPEPDLGLVAALAARLDTPIVAEGRITTPAQAAEALRCGAWAVCVGKAIAEPRFIAERFVQALHGVPAADEPSPDGA